MRIDLWALCGLLLVAAARADEWPQWMGPSRDNVWQETGIVEKFPEGGPKILWKAKVAGGYAGPAVASGMVYVTDYVTSDDVKVDNFARAKFTGQERVLCLQEGTGELVWKHEYPVTYGISYPAGPRCTPLVHGDKVYTLGAEGQLLCFDAMKGTVVWSKDLKAEYKTESPLWGYSAHPLIEGDTLITLAGGSGTHVVALNKETGAEVWRSQTQKEQGYVPPSIKTIRGERHLVIAGPQAVVGLNPATGERLWKHPYEADNGSIIMTPVVVDNYLYLAGYKGRNLLVKFTRDQADPKTEWQDKRDAGMSPVNVQPISDGSTLYGFDEGGEMMGVSLPSGRRLWKTVRPVSERRKEGSATAFIVRQADRYWLFNEKGELVIATLSPKGYDEIDRAKVIKPTNNAFGREVVWCAPAYANRRMYVRNDEECICVDLAAE